MAAEVSGAVNVNNDEIKTWSIHKCIFCNKLLDGKSKILVCLHLICINCVEKYTINSGKYFFVVFIILLDTIKYINNLIIYYDNYV